MEELRLWAPVVIALISLVTTWGLAARMAKRSEIEENRREAEKASAELKSDIRTVRDHVDGLERRTARAEATIEHLPDRNLTHRLELTMTELKGQMGIIEERLKPIGEMARRAQEMVIEEPRR